MKVNKYVCDRCKKEFNVREGAKHDSITRHSHWSNDKPEKIDLCFDCDSALSFFLEKVKEFDELADKLSEETD